MTAPATSWFMLDGEAVRKIVRVMLRLYREDRMSGDDMRNAAQALEAALLAAVNLTEEDR